MSNLSRNIALACEHPEALATLHRDEQTAWCPVCEADVEVRRLPEAPPGTVPLPGMEPAPHRSESTGQSAEEAADIIRDTGA